MRMTSRQQLLTALDGGVPDRLPVTTHHLMTYFLDKYMGGASNREFFDHFDMDAYYWTTPYRPDPDQGEYYDPLQAQTARTETRQIVSDQNGAWNRKRYRMQSTGSSATGSLRRAEP